MKTEDMLKCCYLNFLPVASRPSFLNNFRIQLWSPIAECAYRADKFEIYLLYFNIPPDIYRRIDQLDLLVHHSMKQEAH